MGIDDLLAKLRALKPQAAASYKVREIRPGPGPFARGQQEADSDIDVLVDFDDGETSST